ncbi:MAG: hypothetical protein ACUVQG_13245 [Thermogutta sp.]
MSHPDDDAFNLDAILEGATSEVEGMPGVSPTEEATVPPVPEPAAAPPAEARPPRPSLRERLRALDIYTVMLGLAFLAIVVAVVMLLVELSRYQWDTSARSARQTVQLVVSSQDLV